MVYYLQKGTSKMCERFNNNRQRFVALVHTLKKFEEREIVDKFRKQQKGDIIIDGSQTIPQYLRVMKEQGALKYDCGRYYVPKAA